MIPFGHFCQTYRNDSRLYRLLFISPLEATVVAVCVFWFNEQTFSSVKGVRITEGLQCNNRDKSSRLG